MKKNNIQNSKIDDVLNEIKTIASHLEQLSLVELVVALEVLDTELESVIGQVEVVVELTESRKKSFKDLISMK